MSATKTTLKSMQADGWKLKTIAGVKCLVLANPDETFVCQWRRYEDSFDPAALVAVIQALGMPDKWHYSGSNTIGTIEYYGKI